MRSLSLVVPVYNAPDLARALLDRIGAFARVAAESGFELVETILVDDGSAVDLRTSLAKPPPGVRILRCEVNRGKGAAVRSGALSAVGGWVLMSDVDLSAPFDEFARLAPDAAAWIVCGSRHGRPGMPPTRRLLSGIFHLLVWLTGVRGVQDTQCGFKLFRMDVMRSVFETLRTERFAFDVELIRRVQAAGGTVKETPVAWHGGRRSSLRVLRDAPRMLWDLLRIARDRASYRVRAPADR